MRWRKTSRVIGQSDDKRAETPRGCGVAGQGGVWRGGLTFFGGRGRVEEGERSLAAGRGLGVRAPPPERVGLRVCGRVFKNLEREEDKPAVKRKSQTAAILTLLLCYLADAIIQNKL